MLGLLGDFHGATMFLKPLIRAWLKARSEVDFFAIAFVAQNAGTCLSEIWSNA